MSSAYKEDQFLYLLIDRDGNDNGLIDITSLEQLDAIRYDLDGDGTPSGDAAAVSAYEAAFGLTAGAAISCTGGCSGYELMTNLDFEDNASYADGSREVAWIDPANGGTASTTGWLPIGDNSTGADDSRFTAIFEGNDKTISNLFIDRSSTRFCRSVWVCGYWGRDKKIGAIRRICDRSVLRRRSCGVEFWHNKCVLCDGECRGDRNLWQRRRSCGVTLLAQ